MRVLLAFDKFKDSLTAPAACDATAKALRARHPEWTLDLCPLADGGEGFCEILTRAAGGTVETHPVPGPRDAVTPGTVGFVPLARIPAAARELLQIESAGSGGVENPLVAVIEMASASGLALLTQAQRDPWETHTVGTGDLMRLAASRPGVVAILLGVGGSATNDLGLGALSSLGLKFLTPAGDAVWPPVPGLWSRISQLGGEMPAGFTPVRIACDVTNPLLGPRGATATYGPQKGLKPADTARLDHECARLGLMLCQYFKQPESLMDEPGTGAAGGISFGLMAATGAKLLPGFDLVSAWLDVEAKLAQADLVITGEGRFDDTSLTGKGPGAVAARALALGKPVQVFAGAVKVTGAKPAGLSLHAITPPGMPLERALREASTLLEAAVREAL